MKFAPLAALSVMVLCPACLELGTGTQATTGASTGSTGGIGGTGGTGGKEITGSSSSGAGPVALKACDPNDSSLVACFPFEDDATDVSNNHSPVAPVALTYTDGVLGRAASFGGTSQVTLPDAAYWSMPQFTIELWYYQRSYSSVRMGLIDGDNRFGVFVYGQGDLRCSRGVEYFVVSQGLPLNTWTHVACTYDGTTLYMYINGVQKAGTGAPPISMSGTIAIGSNAPTGDGFDGLIDELRVWNIAHTPAAICQAAGKSGC